jgi:hypothetical protein
VASPLPPVRALRFGCAARLATDAGRRGRARVISF